MKKPACLLFLLLLITACNRQSNTRVLEQSPEALEESGLGSFEIKRGKNILERLYSELAENDPTLKKLEEDIKQLHEQDSTRAFNAYNSKSQYYYNDAKHLATNVHDSLIAKKMVALITGSIAKYDKHTTDYQGLLADIDVKTANLNDLHTLIKLTYTLPLIEEYQKSKLPSDKPIKNYRAQLEKTLRYEESLIQK